MKILRLSAHTLDGVDSTQSTHLQLSSSRVHILHRSLFLPPSLFQVMTVMLECRQRDGGQKEEERKI